MDRLESLRRFRRVIAPLGLVLCISPAYGQSNALADSGCQPPLKTAEYEISALDWNAALVASIRDRAVLLEALGKRKSPPTAQDYLALGGLIEKHFGYHYLAFRFYRKALDLAKNERGKKWDRIRTEAERRRSDMARRRFQAMRELILGDDQQVFVSPALKVLPTRNLIERRDMKKGNGFYSSRYEPLATQYLQSRISEEEYYRRLERLRAETQKLTHLDVLSDDEGLPYFAGLSDVSSLYFRYWSDDGDELYAKRIAGFAIVPVGFGLVAWHLPFVHKASKFLPEGMLDTPGLRRITRFEYKPKEGGCQLATYTVDQKDELLGGFLRIFPKFQAEAGDLIERVEYDVAVQLHDYTRYETFLRKYPEGPYTAKARRASERKYYEMAVSLNGPNALNDYLNKYPEGEYQTQALVAITEFAYEAAIEIGTEEALVQFLAEHPSSKWEDEARNEIAKLSYLEARDSNTIADYQVFIREYPESRFAAEATKAIQAIKAGESFNVVRRLNTLAGYTRFLNEFPNSSFQSEARAMVAFFRCMKERTIGPCGEFLERRRKSAPKGASAAEKNRVLAVIADLALENKNSKSDASAHIVLHQETRDGRLVPAILSLAITKEQEFYGLSAMDVDQLGRIVLWSGPTSGTNLRLDEWGPKGFFQWSSSARPSIRSEFQANTRFKHRYQVEVSIDVFYQKSYSGIIWFNPDYKEEIETWTTTYRSQTTVEIGKKLRSESFEFERFPIAKREGLTAFYAYDTAADPSEPEMRVIRVLE